MLFYSCDAGTDSADYDEMMVYTLQVSPESTKQGHDTLGVIALDCMGNISAGKCLIIDNANLLINVWINSWGLCRKCSSVCKYKRFISAQIHTFMLRQRNLRY